MNPTAAARIILSLDGAAVRECLHVSREVTNPATTVTRLSRNRAVLYLRRVESSLAMSRGVHHAMEILPWCRGKEYWSYYDHGYAGRDHVSRRVTVSERVG